MQLMKCDRCGAVGIPEGFAYVETLIRHHPETAYTRDLCVACKRGLDDWLGGIPERTIKGAGGAPLPFEQVLSRIRAGANPRIFRRPSWRAGVSLICDDRYGSKALASGEADGTYICDLDALDIMACDWEEASE